MSSGRMPPSPSPAPTADATSSGVPTRCSGCSREAPGVPFGGRSIIAVWVLNVLRTAADLPRDVLRGVRGMVSMAAASGGSSGAGEGVWRAGGRDVKAFTTRPCAVGSRGLPKGVPPEVAVLGPATDDGRCGGGGGGGAAGQECAGGVVLLEPRFSKKFANKNSKKLYCLRQDTSKRDGGQSIRLTVSQSVSQSGSQSVSQSGRQSVRQAEKHNLAWWQPGDKSSGDGLLCRTNQWLSGKTVAGRSARRWFQSWPAAGGIVS